MLEAIHLANQQGVSIGRKTLSEKSGLWKKPLTEQQIRRRLDTLEQQAYVVTNRGRGGIKLTRNGLDYLRALEGTT